MKQPTESTSAITSYLIWFTVWLQNTAMCHIPKIYHRLVGGGVGKGMSLKQIKLFLTQGFRTENVAQWKRRYTHAFKFLNLFILWANYFFLLIWCCIYACVEIFPSKDSIFSPQWSRRDLEDRGETFHLFGPTALRGRSICFYIRSPRTQVSSLDILTFGKWKHVH